MPVSKDSAWASTYYARTCWGSGGGLASAGVRRQRCGRAGPLETANNYWRDRSTLYSMAAECVAASVAAAAVAWALRRRNSPCTAQQPKLTNARVFDDVGGYIGLDIGGSLAKLVYFEPDESSQAASEYDKAKVSSGFRSSPSSCRRGHLQSAQRISAFIRKSSTYGTTGAAMSKPVMNHCNDARNQPQVLETRNFSSIPGKCAALSTSCALKQPAWSLLLT